MSPVDLLVADPDLESVPFSVRLATRRAQQPIASHGPASRAANRRAFHRRQGSELEWVRAVRFARGGDVRLVDLSEGGALLEVDAPLKLGTILTLEISGTGLETSVPLEVLRCYITSLRGDVATYRGACVFTEPIELPGLGGVAPAAAAFVGTDAALTYLLQRCAAKDVGAAPHQKSGLTRTEILHVLEALHARRPPIGADPSGRHIVDLLGAMLTPLHRGAARDVVLNALEQRFRGLPDRWQSRLHATFGRLGALVEHCTAIEEPAARIEPAAAPEIPVADVPADLSPAAPATTADTAFQKLVVRFSSGSIMKGFSQDFHPSRQKFSLWPTINATVADRATIPVSSLKAVFFVRDFNGNPAYRERKTFTVRGQGRRVEVTFTDGEVMLGTTLNYRPDAQGFFLSPADPGGNNTRIFVVSAAMRRVRFL